MSRRFFISFGGCFRSGGRESGHPGPARQIIPFQRAGGQRAPLSLPKGASRPRCPESAVFSADFDDGIMTSYPREREVLSEEVLIRVSYILKG